MYKHFLKISALALLVTHTYASAPAQTSQPNQPTYTGQVVANAAGQAAAFGAQNIAQGFTSSTQNTPNLNQGAALALGGVGQKLGGAISAARCQAVASGAFSVGMVSDPNFINPRVEYAIQTVIGCSESPRQISNSMKVICQSLQNPTFKMALQGRLNGTIASPAIQSFVSQNPGWTMANVKTVFATTMTTQVAARFYGSPTFAGCPIAGQL